MNRIKIKEALFEAAKAIEYQPLIVTESELQSAISTMPTMWIQPLKLKAITGRNRGRATYTVTITAMSEWGTVSPENKDDTRAKLEQDILSMLTEASRAEFVAEIESIKITPSTKPTTKHGDLSITAEANIVTIYSA